MSNATKQAKQATAPLSALDIIQASGQATNLATIAGTVQRVTADYGRLKGKVRIIGTSNESCNRKTLLGARRIDLDFSALSDAEVKRYQSCLKTARAFMLLSGVWILDDTAKQSAI